VTVHKAQRLQHVAELLNAVGRDTETKILSTLEEANPNLASQIREKMFTFDDLTLIDNRQMQVLLKELDPELLVLSMKTASDAVKELIFSSMSTRAADGMKDDLENLGPRRREYVEAAQMKIVQTARKMMEEGKIVILGDMLELGKKGKKLHMNLSKIINTSDIDKVYVYGKLMKNTFINLSNKKKGKMFENLKTAYRNLNNIIHNKDLLMIKGSNATGLNTFAKNIKRSSSSAI